VDLAQVALVARIGGTPTLDLSHLVGRPRVRLLAKLESANPGGSVKDRAALGIVRAAYPALRSGAELVDATSGNTGVAYAVLAAALGFRARLFVPANASPSRLTLLRALGVAVVLTDPLEGTDGAQAEARAFAEAHKDALLVDQYANEANPRAHYETTGPELWSAAGGRLTHFVAGIGTGGTITGCGRFFRERATGVRVVGVEPAEALHGLEGLKHLATAHVPEVLDESVIDAHVAVPTQRAWSAARDLARRTGVLVGPSSGAALVAALEIARGLDEGVVGTVFPDGAERYVGTAFGAYLQSGGTEGTDG